MPEGSTTSRPRQRVRDAGSEPYLIVRRPGAAEENPRRTHRIRRGTELTLAIGVPLVLIVLWQVASSRNWIDSHLYPSPTAIVKDARRLIKNGTLQHDVWVSTRRILYGYLLGTVSGIIVGFITGAHRLTRAALEPLLSSLYTVPKLALLPIFLTVFGFGEKAIVMLIATTVFFFVWISTMAAVIGVAEGYREAARSFGVNSWQMFRHVLWPASLPAIFVGMRIAAGVSVLMLIGVEFVIASDGLGYLIEQGRTLLLLQQTYVGIVCAALLGLVFTWLIRVLARLLIPWSKPDNTADMIRPSGTKEDIVILRKRRRLCGLVAAATGALTIAACGSSSGGNSSDTTPSSAGGTAALAKVAGCGANSHTTDQQVANNQVARCDSGAPAPKPLSSPATVSVAIKFKSTAVAPILLGQAMGEFKKENLTVKIVPLLSADAIPQMAKGSIDITSGATDATFLNAVAGGIDIRWNLGNYVPPDAGNVNVAQTGLWVRKDIFKNPNNPDLKELEGKTVASAVGPGSSITYPISQAVAKAGGDITKVKFKVLQSPDMVQALQNKAVDAAWLLDPYWLTIANDPNFKLVVTQPPGEPLGGFFFGPSMYKNKAVGEAFTRAYVRTINTYLTGDYRKNTQVVDALAKAEGVPAETLVKAPLLLFDWEIPAGTTDRIQSALKPLGVLSSESQPESTLVDRSFYQQAVGSGS